MIDARSHIDRHHGVGRQAHTNVEEVGGFHRDMTALGRS